MASQVILVTGAGSGFGLLTAKTLSKSGHIVYGGLYGHDRPAEDPEHPIHNVELDITDQASIDSAVARIFAEQQRIDCVVHNAGHMCMGPSEAFSPEQFHQYFDVNCVGAHRLNQAILPTMRKAGRGHIVWVSSSSARGGSGPLLGPYFAAKAAMHSLAISMSTEIACWGIETTIIVPGIFTTGTNHFATAGKPGIPQVADEYMNGPLKGADSVMLEHVEQEMPDASPQLVGDAIASAVGAPRGKKPFRIPVDPFQDGSDEVMSLSDRWHEDFLKRCGISEICAFRG